MFLYTCACCYLAVWELSTHDSAGPDNSSEEHHSAAAAGTGSLHLSSYNMHIHRSTHMFDCACSLRDRLLIARVNLALSRLPHCRCPKVALINSLIWPSDPINQCVVGEQTLRIGKFTVTLKRLLHLTHGGCGCFRYCNTDGLH